MPDSQRPLRDLQYSVEYNKQYYRNNREELLEYQKQYYRNNREAISRYKKRWYENRK